MKQLKRKTAALESDPLEALPSNLVVEEIKQNAPTMVKSPSIPRHELHEIFKQVAVENPGSFGQGGKNTLDGGGPVITRAAFFNVLKKKLQTDLNDKEIDRVFDRHDSNKSGSLSFEEFEKAARNNAFLKNLFTEANLNGMAYEIPVDYDFSKTTTENYGIKIA